MKAFDSVNSECICCTLRKGSIPEQIIAITKAKYDGKVSVHFPISLFVRLFTSIKTFFIIQTKSTVTISLKLTLARLLKNNLGSIKISFDH